jgi:hypothetical protein
VGYDFLIAATGARHSYFGHDEWEKFAPGIKTLFDALSIRQEILSAFEAAEIQSTPQVAQLHLDRSRTDGCGACGGHRRACEGFPARSFARSGEALSNLMAVSLSPETMTSTNALKGSA